jgi:4-amino-4-deoxy-L-arabinose transferase-like glycosyltransferase
VQQRLQTIAIVVALAAIAALPRFHALGFLSFYGDEQLTAMVSRSIAEGHGPHMPSGMPYLRGLPLSYMTAAATELLGPAHEFAYRVPAAICGVLTVPLLFLLAQPFVGAPAAVVASLLLALADWHVVTSREARMYAPFVLCFLATVFVGWRWTRKPPGHGWLLLATVALFCAAVAFHQLGILAALLLPIPLAFIGWSRVSTVALLAVPAATWLTAQYYNQFVGGNFSRWARSMGLDGSAPLEDTAAPLAIESLSLLSPLSLAGGGLGTGLGLWLARLAAQGDEDRSRGAQLRRLAHYALAALAGGLAGAGQLHAAGIAALVFLVIHPRGGLAIARRAALPASGIALLALVQLALAVIRLGPAQGLKHVTMFPFPYLAELFILFPGLMLFFAGTCLVLALRPQQEQDLGLRACVIAAVVPLAAIGVARSWGEIRYLSEVFPFLLLVSAAGLFHASAWIGRRSGRWGARGAVVLALAVAASGLLGGHGLPQAWNKATAVHGTPQIYRNPYYFPDHKAPGEFVRSRRKPGDLVVVENALRQLWYVGSIDYWLRSPTGGNEVFRAPDGTTRDVYLNLVVPETAVLSRLRDASERIWIITSAEHWDGYFSPEQAAWLEEVQRTHQPVFTGRDGVTRVYCVHCDARE